VVAVRARRIGTVTGIVPWRAIAAGGAVAGRRDRGLCLCRRGRHRRPVEPADLRGRTHRLWLAGLCRRGPGSRSPRFWAFVGHGAGLLWPARGARGGDALWSKLGDLRVISSVGLTMFPFILPSSSTPNSSLTVWDARPRTRRCSSCWSDGDLHADHPAYTAWVYRVLWGKVTEADVTANSDTVY
jgi:cytochrome d ubiquinol oxidase subunit II